MTRFWQIGFWIAIAASGLWVVATLTVGIIGLRAWHEGFHSSWPAAGLLGVALLQPPLVLGLGFRAIRLRKTGNPPRILARALLWILPALLFPACILAVREAQQGFPHRADGTIAYRCSQTPAMADYDPDIAGPTVLRLTGSRHPGRLDSWMVEWVGKKPIQAESFAARTGNIGGSQGIKWSEPGGASMVAYLSFSDLINEDGPTSLWVTIKQAAKPADNVHPSEPVTTELTCGPERAGDRR